MICDFCGDSAIGWSLPLSNGSGFQVTCDACLQLIQANDLRVLIGRTAAFMVAQKLERGDNPIALRSTVWAAYRKLLPLLGPPTAISPAAMVRLRRVAQRHKPA